MKLGRWVSVNNLDSTCTCIILLFQLLKHKEMLDFKNNEKTKQNNPLPPTPPKKKQNMFVYMHIIHIIIW